MSVRDMIYYLVFVEFLRLIVTAFLALVCAVAGLTLFRRPMWQ